MRLVGRVLLFLTSCLCGCGIYTFSGSSLPGYLKTADVPLFVNESLRAGVAEEVTQEVNTRVGSSGLLRVVASGGDATISGRVLSYANQPYTYDTKAPRQADVSEYAVRIAAEVVFSDNKKGKPIYKGTIVGEGIYDFKTETEDIGRAKAVKDLSEQIVQNSVQGW